MRFLNFGSLNIDHVYSVNDFVTAGETVSSLRLQTFCGGKGLNQSVALAQAGGRVYHAGAIGKDGRALTDFLSVKGVDTSLVREVDGFTGHAVIQVNSQGENCIILHKGANFSMDMQFADKVLGDFGNGDVLLLQNEINMLSYIITAAKKKKMKIALNPSPIDGEINNLPLEKVDWLILNSVEGRALAGRQAPDDIINSLNSRYPDTAVILTLGEKGAVYSFRGNRIFHQSFPVKAVDTTAAGDTFTGYFIALVGEGFTPEKALKTAVAAAAVAVTRMGAATSVPSLAEVREFISKSGDTLGTEIK